MFLAVENSVRELFDGTSLITARLVIYAEFEWHDLSIKKVTIAPFHRATLGCADADSRGNSRPVCLLPIPR